MSESISDLIEQGGGLLRYTAATRYSELRLIAGPATLDIGPLDLGVEDHATNAVAHRAAQRGGARPAAGHPGDRAADGVDRRRRRCPRAGRLPAPIAAAFDAVRRVREPLGPGRARAAAVHAAVSAACAATILEAAAGRGRPGAMTAGVAGAPTTIRRPGALVAVSVLAAFTANFDLQIVNLALPVIGEAFGVSQSTLAWAVNAYVLPFAVSILAVGRLGDRFGLRPVLTIGGLLFAVGRRAQRRSPRRTACCWPAASCRGSAARRC